MIPTPHIVEHPKTVDKFIELCQILFSYPIAPGSPHVFDIGAQVSQRGFLAIASQAFPLALREVGEVDRMCPVGGGAKIGIPIQPFHSKFPHGLQHHQAGFSNALIHLPDQAFIHQGGQAIEYVCIRSLQAFDPVGSHFDRFELTATREHG